MVGQAMPDTGLVATNACSDIVASVRRCFIRKFGVSDQGPYHTDHVRFAFAQYL